MKDRGRRQKLAEAVEKPAFVGAPLPHSHSAPMVTFCRRLLLFRFVLILARTCNPQELPPWPWPPAAPLRDYASQNKCGEFKMM
jgi:hypothetical protein